MSELSKLGESLFDEAIASGQLKPPESGVEGDLEAYFAVPEELRMGMSVLKGQGFVPPEVELLKQAAQLEESLANCEDEEAQRGLRREIEKLRVQFRIAAERLRRL